MRPVSRAPIEAVSLPLRLEMSKTWAYTYYRHWKKAASVEGALYFGLHLSLFIMSVSRVQVKFV